MSNFDFTPLPGAANRRPTAAQIIKRWKTSGKPKSFSVEYGETYASFEYLGGGRWNDSGNGCRGVDRAAVVKGLAAYHARQASRFSDLWRD